MTHLLKVTLFTLLFCLSACRGTRSDAPDLISTMGTVTKASKPAGNMNVTFYPESTGAPSYATTDAAGKFELIYNDGRKGAVAGPHRVVISTPAPPSPSPEDPMPQSATPAQPAIEKTFKANVSREKNSFEFTLD